MISLFPVWVGLGELIAKKKKIGWIDFIREACISEERPRVNWGAEFWIAKTTASAASSGSFHHEEAASPPPAELQGPRFPYGGIRFLLMSLLYCFFFCNNHLVNFKWFLMGSIVSFWLDETVAFVGLSFAGLICLTSLQILGIQAFLYCLPKSQLFWIPFFGSVNVWWYLPLPTKPTAQGNWRLIAQV